MINKELLVDDYSQMGAEFENLAKSRKRDLPNDLESKHETAMKQMAQLNGADFDRQFMQHNVKEHETDFKVFQHYAQQEPDADIRQLAQKGVKMLEKHLQTALDVQKRSQA